MKRGRDARRVLRLLLGAAPAAAAIYLLLTLTASLLPVGQVWLSKVVVDDLGGGGHGPGAGAVGRGVATAAVLYVVIQVTLAGIGPVLDVLSTWLRDHSVAALDRELMGAGERLADLGRVERPAFQDELRLADDVVAQAPTLFRFLQTGVSTTITLAGLLVLLGRLQPLLPLALVLCSVPHVVVLQRASLLRYRAMLQRSPAAREMDYCVRLCTDPAAAKEIRVFGLGPFFLLRFRRRYAAALQELTGLRVKELGIAAAFGGFHALALAGGFWYVAARVGSGALPVGELALYLGAVAQAESRLLFLSTAFGSVQQVLLRLPGLFGLLDSARPTIAMPAGEGLPAPATLQSGIELQRVSFRYPEGIGNVLTEVTVRLPAGQITALVGLNGAGKSTLVKLLTRMYDPDDGEILLDGVPLAAYDLVSLRHGIATVYQDFARFALTLAENIAVGANGPGVAERVEQAARWSGADVVAASLPGGYATLLTRQYAGGVDLSGGEWQKVALARAYIRDAAIIILDEPTAALDADAEAALLTRFRELIAGKTALLISHRLSTVRFADQILVLDGGRVTERGSHPELMAAGGQYARLFALQAAHYR